ncbi:MAG TPA: 6-bladed beta-propeller [Longimicrobium sp.]|nr:6-bladed beta-propeller [Longimicrobium sp.]
MRHALARWSLLLLLVAAGGLAAYRAVRPASSPREPEPGPTLADALDGRTAARLTVPGSPPESTFGLVGDVAMAKEGRTFVLDVLNREVGAFNGAAERTALLGRPGPGPGEFLGPIALAVDDAGGGVYVLDERKQGIDVFDPARGEWQRTIPLDFHAADLCFLSGRLYVLGGRNGFLLHEVSKDGAVLRSFAPDADSENLLLRGYRSGGYLGCAPNGEIAFLPTLRPVVTRFSAERGTLLGTASIPGYHAVRVRLVERGVQFDVPGGGSHDYGSSIIPLPGGDWLVQVGRLKRGSNSHHEFISVRSHRLSARDGQIRPLPVQLPRVMAAGEEVVYAVDTSPYPAVRIVPNPLSELLP